MIQYAIETDNCDNCSIAFDCLFVSSRLHVSCNNLTESYGIISLWGCNQTPTYAPPPDLSSYFNTQYESGNAIMTRAFTKSTSERGNDVVKELLGTRQLLKLTLGRL